MTTIRFLFDEDVDHRILRGLRRREPTVDIAAVQEVGLRSRPDPDILAWAAENQRLLVTQDVNTMTKHVSERLEAGKELSGVLFIPRDVTISTAIDDLLLVWSATAAEDWRDRYDFLPLTV